MSDRKYLIQKVHVKTLLNILYLSFLFCAKDLVRGVETEPLNEDLEFFSELKRMAKSVVRIQKPEVGKVILNFHKGEEHQQEITNHLHLEGVFTPDIEDELFYWFGESLMEASFSSDGRQQFSNYLTFRVIEYNGCEFIFRRRLILLSKVVKSQKGAGKGK